MEIEVSHHSPRKFAIGVFPVETGVVLPCGKCGASCGNWGVPCGN